MNEIKEICRIIVEKVPGTKCTVSPSNDQIAVQFESRPDVVIHLLTPYYQKRLKKDGLSNEDIQQLIYDVSNITEFKAYSDVLIDDVNLFLSANNI